MDVKLPQLAEGVESGTVVNILVSEGQEIKKDQPFMELETQKAVGSIPAPDSGVVTKIHVKEGMEVAVGQVLISISSQTTAQPSAPAGTNSQTRPAPEAPRSPQQQQQQPVASAPPQPAPVQPIGAYHYESKSGAPPPAAPSIRRIAQELGIDLSRVKGTEAGGRIVMKDLRDYVAQLQQLAFSREARSAQEEPGTTKTTGRPESAIDFAKWGPIRREKMSSLRRTVSRRMVESWTTIPKINQFDEADITPLLALRKKFAEAYEKKNARLTLTPFILKVAANALKKFPRANASVDEATNDIIYKDYCHIGVAVDTEAGLIVPTLRDVDKKNLVDLARELNQLTEKTRQRKIGVEELQGGSFTISNQGSIGGSYFTPIIYAPQVAILGVGQGAQKPAVVDGKVAIRTLLPLCLAYDHRVLDGGDAVRFLTEIVAGLQNFPEAEVKIK
jgi:pyruvate dehydrogenase E2 component (dihydrolipoamide acetyltransferase)